MAYTKRINCTLNFKLLNWLWLFSKKPPSHQRHPSPIIMVPVTLSNLQLDARLWSAFTLVPFAPYVSSWRYAVMETPHVEFDMTIGRHLWFLPPRITSVPVLRQLFFDILAREIPRDFFFLAYNTVDFTPKDFQEKRREFSNMTLEQIGQLLEEDVKAWFPQQWNLYQALNLNQTNGLTLDELKCGLIDWGYSTKDATACFAQMDVQHKGSISFPSLSSCGPMLLRMRYLWNTKECCMSAFIVLTVYFLDASCLAPQTPSFTYELPAKG